MKRLGLTLLWLTVLPMFVGSATVCGAAEHLMYKMPEGKKPKLVKEFTIKPRESYLHLFVLEGEKIDNWAEALQVINTWRKNYPPTSEEAYNIFTEKGKKGCQNYTFNLISKDNNSVLYETLKYNCPPEPDQNSINRILYGNKDVFHLIYTNKVRNLPKETRDEWIRILTEAYIETK